ncbi:chloride channel protein [Curtobacterium ammoniigenes]|uniref:chloride channel protein n=1 Tax=Curtobacterium ammoniigenes TaxID=395387 RepID=UPI00082F276A|nr:chloride channel protein [Curtobacterium ammoniigenes]
MPDASRTTPRWVAKLVVVTALVGISGGVAGIGVYVALHVIQVVAFGFPWHTSAEAADNSSAIGRFLGLAAAGVIAGPAWWALRRFGKPIVSVQKAVAGTRMHGLVTVANAGVQILSVGLGASIGKEVAPREVAAWLAQVVTERAGLSKREARILIACGAASGLAAVYDVPLGGALFTLEVLLGELTFAAALPAFATNAIAAFVARLVVPVDTLYAVPHMTMSASLVAWSIVVGPVLGIAGVGFSRLTGRMQNIAPRRSGVLLSVPIVFAIVGLIAVAFPSVMGNGRAMGLVAMNERLGDPSVLGLAPIVLMLVLALAKTVTTTATIGAGAVGGTLTPSIAIGSASGAFLGGLWLLFWPGSGLAAFAFIGAAAFLATTMRAPFTALALVAEFTNQGTQIFIPAMLAVSGAVAVSYVIGRRRLAGVE